MSFIITPDNLKSVKASSPQLFLAGSIEQGKATNWQKTAIDFYSSKQDLADLVIVNPRRESWNPNLEQKFENVDFNWQVSFELEHLEKADAVIMWLEPGTLSPISLFEFGLLTGWTSMGALNKIVVGCPDGFWRKGNVDVVTNRYRIQAVQSLEDLFEEGYNVLKRNHSRRIAESENFKNRIL